MVKSGQIAFNMVAQVTSFVISLAINFFLTPLIITKIGKDIYGFLGLANNFIEYVGIITIAVNGMANRFVTVAYTRGDKESASRYFTSVTIANVALTVMFFLPAVLIVTYLGKIIDIPFGFEADVKTLWGFIFAMFAVNLVSSRLDVAMFAKNRLDITGLVNMLSNILRAVLLICVFMVLPPKISYVGFILLLCAILKAVLNTYYKNKLTPDLKFGIKYYSLSTVFEVLKTGMWNSVSQLSQIMFTGLDLLIANLFIGAAGMSLLSVAKTIPASIIAFIGVIAGVFYPIMTIAYSAKGKESLCTETKFASKMCGFVCSVPIMGFVVFGKVFFRLWLPTLSSHDIDEIQILSVLTFVPQMLSVFVFPLHQVSTITCKIRIPAILDCIIGIINIIVVYVLLKFTNLGLYAIAGTSSALLILRILIFVPLYAAHLVKMKYTTFYPILLRGIALNIVLCLGFYFVNKSIDAFSWLQLFFGAGICAVIGYAAGFIIVFSNQEKKRVILMIKSKIFKRGV